MRATCPTVMAAPFFRVTMMFAKSSGRFMRASIFTTRSCVSERVAPTGRSWFSRRTALATCSAVMPSDSIACGLRYTLISRLVPPTSVTEPAPRTFSSLFFSVWSAQLVSSTADMAGSAPLLAVSGNTAIDQMARLAGSKRSTRGSLTSSRSNGRMAAIFSRTSSAARRPSTYN